MSRTRAAALVIVLMMGMPTACAVDRGPQIADDVAAGDPDPIAGGTSEPGSPGCRDPLAGETQVHPREAIPKPPQAPGPGVVISVSGVPRPELACTLLGCGSENACCNSCGAGPDCPFSVDDEHGGRICLRGAAFSAQGNECSVACAPFACNTRRRYRFVGSLVVGEHGARSIGVTSYCLVEQGPAE